jgi:peptidoglycan/xylan/chitin deacetylase (PgdA/CDA1 family)
VGNNIKNNPALCDEILSAGHLIGNHTFNHRKLGDLDRNSAGAEIDAFNHIMEDGHNYSVKYFRPPHGRFTLSTKKMLAKRGMTNVMWSLLTHDYTNDLNLVKFVVGKYIKKNSIVVLHDSVKSGGIIKDSINIIAESSADKGYEIGEPSECLN